MKPVRFQQLGVLEERPFETARAIVTIPLESKYPIKKIPGRYLNANSILG